jgi:hypothetical protein
MGKEERRAIKAYLGGGAGEEGEKKKRPLIISTYHFYFVSEKGSFFFHFKLSNCQNEGGTVCKTEKDGSRGLFFCYNFRDALSLT